METNNVFVIFLRFSKNKALSKRYMAEHVQWIEDGLKEGIFLMAGSLGPNLGGAILANKISKPDLIKRINTDPFVMTEVVSYEVFEVSLSFIQDDFRKVLN